MAPACLVRVSTLSWLLAALLHATPGLAADVAAAEALFQEGRRLMLEGKTKEGCDKLAASQRLDPSSGTLINLATCHAKLGLTATAWAEFLAAASLANAQGRSGRAAEAERRASELEPLVSYVTIRVEQPVDGLTVKRDSTDVVESALGVELPVDPGTHTVTASAYGYEDWSTTFTIENVSERRVIAIPALERAAPEPSPVAAPPAAPIPRDPVVPPPAEPEPDRGVAVGESSLGAGFWIASGTALAAAGVSSVFGLLSLDSYRDAEKACPDHVECQSRAIVLGDRAENQANVANVALGTAIAAAAVAGVLYLTSDDSAPKVVGRRMSW